MSIPEFYRGRCIFLTGATGFMGKVLVYKLLKDCGDLERIYLLMRAKKGVEPKQRLEEYVNHMVSYIYRLVEVRDRISAAWFSSVMPDKHLLQN